MYVITLTTLSKDLAVYSVQDQVTNKVELTSCLGSVVMSSDYVSLTHLQLDMYEFPTRNQLYGY